MATSAKRPGLAHEPDGVANGHDSAGEARSIRLTPAEVIAWSRLHRTLTVSKHAAANAKCASGRGGRAQLSRTATECPRGDELPGVAVDAECADGRDGSEEGFEVVV